MSFLISILSKIKFNLLFLLALFIGHSPVLNFSVSKIFDVILGSTLLSMAYVNQLSLFNILLLSLLKDFLDGSIVGLSFLEYLIFKMFTHKYNKIFSSENLVILFLVFFIAIIIILTVRLLVNYAYGYRLKMIQLWYQCLLLLINFLVLKKFIFKSNKIK